MKAGGPLLGYNNNIPYRGQVFHVQTEDSGTKRPHVITHLFADGGRIIKTRKTSYAHFLDGENVTDRVRALMREQHKGMVLSLRDGEFDHIIEPDPERPVGRDEIVEVVDGPDEPPQEQGPPSAPLELLERAAEVDDKQFEEEIERITTHPDEEPAPRDAKPRGAYSFVGDREPATTARPRRRMRATSKPAPSDAPDDEGDAPPAVDVAGASRRRGKPARSSPPTTKKSGPPGPGKGAFGASVTSGRRFDELVAAFLSRRGR